MIDSFCTIFMLRCGGLTRIHGWVFVLLERRLDIARITYHFFGMVYTVYMYGQPKVGTSGNRGPGRESKVHCSFKNRLLKVTRLDKYIPT